MKKAKMELSNNTVLITGGTSGFGLEFTSRLIALGNTVIITGRNQTKLDETKKRFPKVHTFQSDVTDPKAITLLYEQITKQFPDLNFLINNAGEMRKIHLLDPTIDLQEITREVDINLSGPIRMIQQFLPHLLSKKNATILNVTSGIALVPFPVSPVYGATKSGLRSYTKSLRVQLKNTSIKVFELVAPASSTPLSDKFKNDEGYNPKMIMPPDKLIDVAIKALQNDKLEIYPGLARVLLVMSRLAPKVIFNQMAKLANTTFVNKTS